jgi:hypothetical protein
VPTTLVVEDGSGVAGANSYVSYDDAMAFAALRGFSLGPDQATAEINLIQAADYLEAQRNRYQGWKTNDPAVFVPPEVQPLQWPRTWVFIDAVGQASYWQLLNGYENITWVVSNPFPNDAIPIELINAQIVLAKNVADGVTLMPTQNGPFVTMQKVGTLEKHFSEIVNTSIAPDMLAVNAWLQPLLKNANSAGGLTSIRV